MVTAVNQDTTLNDHIKNILEKAQIAVMEEPKNHYLRVTERLESENAKYKVF